ncbi:MAG: hypothetical protein AABY84_12995 [Candidatus Firestonebacteria bacterium]
MHTLEKSSSINLKDMISRRYFLLLQATVKDKDRMLKAVKKQDDIRNTFGKKDNSWDSVSQVRKLRETRCSS